MRVPDSKRVDALDATKGVLVVFMVLYHTLNYSSQYHLAFRYLSFLPPSFIVISGYLLATVYVSRWPATDPALRLRLISRGVKLIALFLTLNIAAQLIHSRNYHNPGQGLGYFFDHALDVFLYGNARMVVFEILLPIAYLLLLAPFLLCIVQCHRHAASAFTFGILLVLVVAGWLGLESANFDLLSAGVLGMWFGRFSFAHLTSLARWIWLPLLGYILYAVAGLKWGQPFVLQLLGALLALATIYGASLRLGTSGALKHWLVRLGQYSLLSYITQIGILQILSHIFGRPEPASVGLIGMAVGTLALTTAIVEAVAWSRSRVSVINGVYRAVFA